MLQVMYSLRRVRKQIHFLELLFRQIQNFRQQA